MSNTGNIDPFGVKVLICERKKYFIPAYQRGYRWRAREVKKLLDDIASISENATTYCLQPIVVKENGEQFEVIDGQQRLTSLYLICKCLGGEWEPRCEIEYETRKNSWEFLNHVEKYDDNCKANADYYFIYQAYRMIKSYTQIDNVRKNIGKVKAIWYVTDEKDGYELFTRLNSYRIPLTDAELIRALFLRKNAQGIDENRQFEMATEWDQMERELRDPSFWHFLTRNAPGDYTSRLELIFCLIAGKEKAKDHDVFNAFEEEITKDSYELWQRVCNCYTTLRSWYKNHELYHLIGYLVASRHKKMGDIVNKFIPEHLLNPERENMSQVDLFKEVENMVKDSLTSCIIPKGEDNQEDTKLDSLSKLEKLSYENHAHIIRRVLLLFNVMYYMDGSGKTHRFPFNRYITNEWSLEHIHPQNPQGSLYENMESWWKEHKNKYSDDLLNNEWLKLEDTQKEAVTTLVFDLNNSNDKKNYDKKAVNLLFDVIMNRHGVPERHGISNLALLQGSINSSLQNRDFSLKCQRLLSEDAKGTYLLPCTRNAFLKYYTNLKLTQDNKAVDMEFWTDDDRMYYMESIKSALAKYLPE